MFTVWLAHGLPSPDRVFDEFNHSKCGKKAVHPVLITRRKAKAETKREGQEQTGLLLTIGTNQNPENGLTKNQRWR